MKSTTNNLQKFVATEIEHIEERIAALSKDVRREKRKLIELNARNEPAPIKMIERIGQILGSREALIQVLNCLEECEIAKLHNVVYQHVYTRCKLYKEVIGHYPEDLHNPAKGSLITLITDVTPLIESFEKSAIAGYDFYINECTTRCPELQHLTKQKTNAKKNADSTSPDVQNEHSTNETTLQLAL